MSTEHTAALQSFLTTYLRLAAVPALAERELFYLRQQILRLRFYTLEGTETIESLIYPELKALRELGVASGLSIKEYNREIDSTLDGVLRRHRAAYPLLDTFYPVKNTILSLENVVTGQYENTYSIFHRIMVGFNRNVIETFTMMKGVTAEEYNSFDSESAELLLIDGNPAFLGVTEDSLNEAKNNKIGAYCEAAISQMGSDVWRLFKEEVNISEEERVQGYHVLYDAFSRLEQMPTATPHYVYATVIEQMAIGHYSHPALLAAIDVLKENQYESKITTVVMETTQAD